MPDPQDPQAPVQVPTTFAKVNDRYLDLPGDTPLPARFPLFSTMTQLFAPAEGKGPAIASALGWNPNAPPSAAPSWFQDQFPLTTQALASVASTAQQAVAPQPLPNPQAAWQKAATIGAFKGNWQPLVTPKDLNSPLGPLYKFQGLSKRAPGGGPALDDLSNVMGIVTPGGEEPSHLFSEVVPEVQAAIEGAFPTLNKFNKRRGFLPPTTAATILENTPGLPPSLVERGKAWLSTLDRPVHPEEVAKTLTGQDYVPPAALSNAKVGAERLVKGAPVGVNARVMAGRRPGLIKQVMEGAAGREWYTDSGKMILFHAGDDAALADKFSQNLALLSNDNTVGGNLTMSLKGHDQAIADVPIWAGKYPSRQSPPLEGIYREGSAVSGPKKGPFSQQLALGGGFAKVEEARAVNDMWMGEFWGFTNPDGTPMRHGFTDAQHRWMDEQTDKLIERMNKEKVGGFDDWDTGKLQAAAWTAAKIRAEKIRPEDAAKSFATYMQQHYLQTGRDFVPGASTGHLPGLKDINPTERDDYLRRVAAVFHDPQGRDIAGKMAGQLTGGAVDGPAIFVGKQGGLVAVPGLQNLTAVGEDISRDAVKNRYINAPSMALAQSNEAGYGLLTGQDMVAGTYPNVAAPAATRDMFQFKLKAGPFDMNSPIMHDQALAPLIVSGKVAPLPVPGGGIRLLWVGGSEDLPAFQKLSRTLAKQYGDGNVIGSKNVGFAAWNDWGKGEEALGQNYARMVRGDQVADAAGDFHPYVKPAERAALSAQLVKNFDASRPDQARQMLLLDEYAAKQFGLPVSAVLMELKRAIAGEGFAGIERLARQAGVPLAVMLVFTDYVVNYSDEPGVPASAGASPQGSAPPHYGTNTK